MIATNKVEESIHPVFATSTLARKDYYSSGYLKTQVTVRNQDKWSELIGYLENIRWKLLITIDVVWLVKLLVVGGWKRE